MKTNRLLAAFTVVAVVGAAITVTSIRPQAIAQSAYFDRWSGLPGGYHGGYLLGGSIPITSIGGGTWYNPPANAVNTYRYDDGRQQDWDALRNAGRLARSAETYDVSREKDGKLTLKWHGQPNDVLRITFSTLDATRKMLKQEFITRLPAEARLSVAEKPAFYRILVEYMDGTTTKIVSPL